MLKQSHRLRKASGKFALAVFLALALLIACPVHGAADSDKKIRVLIVGGDWKSQLTNATLKGLSGPLRGHFIQQETEKAEPGHFDFTLWTSYEFLQYGDAETLRPFDVILVGDVLGTGIMPRVIDGITQFVHNGGGLWYADNHKAFMFSSKEASFDAVLPIEAVPFHPYDDPPGNIQPACTEKPLNVKPVGSHPIIAGLDFSSAPPLLSAEYGNVKQGATTLATSPAGVPIWVAWEHDGGRALWTGGLFANDEKSINFATWPQIGQLYAHAFDWLAAKSHATAPVLTPITAEGTVTVDLGQKGPELTSKHFGIHGTSDGITPGSLKYFQDLNLDGSFDRIGLTSIKPMPHGARYQTMDDGTDLSTFDPAKYDFKQDDILRASLDIDKTEPIGMYWVPWLRTPPDLPDPARYAKDFAAAMDHFNGPPGSKEPLYLKYFEIMNEPPLGPVKAPPMTHAQTQQAYVDFFTTTVDKVKDRHPGMLFGAGGMDEVPYLMQILDKCGKDLSWLSRHPYGYTGESIFAMQDDYVRHAHEIGRDDVNFIVTEWDFWVYGDPAFDYIMQRWKPVADHADRCLGTLHYRWGEYQEGGYVFGVMGHYPTDSIYGQLPPEWPHPGLDKPITYRYDAFWAMRNCRGEQSAATVTVPELQPSLSPRAYAIATHNGKQFNVTVYYGYPYGNTATGHTVEKLKLHITAPIPPEIKGRSLIVERADSHITSEAPPEKITGDIIDTVIEVPALSAVSLTVR